MLTLRGYGLFRCASLSSSDDQSPLTHKLKLIVLYHLSSHHQDWYLLKYLGLFDESQILVSRLKSWTLKLWWNSTTQNCDVTQQLKLWWNSKSQMVMKLKNSNRDEAQKLKLWWNWNNKIVMKLKNSNCVETEKLILWWK